MIFRDENVRVANLAIVDGVPYIMLRLLGGSAPFSYGIAASHCDKYPASSFAPGLGGSTGGTVATGARKTTRPAQPGCQRSYEPLSMKLCIPSSWCRFAPFNASASFILSLKTKRINRSIWVPSASRDADVDHRVPPQSRTKSTPHLAKTPTH